MSEIEELDDESFWLNKLKEHWTALAVVIIALICALAGAIMVNIWFIETSPIGLQGKATFDRWTLNWVVGYIILIILWELLFVGVPLILFFGLGGYLWWRRLPEEEKQEFKERDKKSRKTKAKQYGGGGGFGAFMFIPYCIYIAVDGNYNAQFGSRSYTYWLASYFLTFMWITIFIGIPIAIIALIVYLWWQKLPEEKKQEKKRKWKKK